jgi:catechol 2,3-dioxygenase-like lactoylglutathione lyase family enzyme
MNPASLNLQNVRKRAKHLLRLHAAGHVPVAERIRRACPAFADRTDREVLDAPFSLAQAQQVVAHELRFEDWTQLKRSIEDMTHHEAGSGPSTASPEVLCTHPQIFVTDMERAAAFYRDRLGFEVGYLYGDPPFYGLVERGGAGLNLRHVDELPFDAEARKREELLAATIVVRHLKELFLAYKEAGLEFHQSYREQPWGAHDFIVADPDGNLIHFATVVEEP